MTLLAQIKNLASLEKSCFTLSEDQLHIWVLNTQEAPNIEIHLSEHEQQRADFFSH